MQITKISIQRPTLSIVVFIVLILLGAYSYTNLNYELAPPINAPVITIVTVYPGASPQEVENSVTKKIEDAVASIENIDELASSSQESFGLTQIMLLPGTDVDLSLRETQRRVNIVKAELPESCEPPVVDKFDIEAMPIILLSASSDMEDTKFYDLIKNRIQQELSQIEGVARINIIGGNEREIRIELNAGKLKTYRISSLQVIEMLKRANLDFPTGKIKNSNGQVMIRLSGKFKTVSEISELVIGASTDGTMVKLKDIAYISDTQKETNLISRTNGREAIGLEIQKQGDANAVNVSEKVRKKLSELEEQHSDDNLSFSIAKDTSEFTLEAANSVMFDLLLAVLLVSAVMLLFLHSLRNAMIVLIAVPASIISTFTAMYLLDYSLNLITLLALSLVVGILVDDAIVVIENIYRHMEMGKKKWQASYDAVKEIGLTVFSITLVLVAVFLPITLIDGIVADIMRQFSIVVVVATLLSLLVSFVLVPMLTSRFAKVEKLNKNKPIGKFVHAFEAFINRIINRTIVLLRWSLHHKAIVLLLALVAFAASILLVPAGFIGSEFMDPGDRSEFMLQIELPKDATIEQTNDVVRQAENYLLSLPEIEKTFTKVGTKSGAFTVFSTDYVAEISVKLVPKDRRKYSDGIMARRVKTGLEENIAGAKFTSLKVNILGMTVPPIVVILTGPDMDSLLAFSKDVKQLIENTEGTVEVSSDVEGGNPEISVNIDREKMAALGLTLGQVGAEMQVAFSGNTDNKFRSGEHEYDIHVRLDEFDRNTLADLENLTFINQIGTPVKLKQFAGITETEGPAKLKRNKRVPSISVQTEVLGRSSGEVGGEIEEKIAQLPRSENINVEFSGMIKKQNESFASLFTALIASIIFVYLIMVALYNSWGYPFVVLFSIPLSVIGALLAMALAKQILSIFTILGIIMLVGLVSKNAIIVVDFANQLKAEGRKSLDAIVEATRLRFRPIVMTNISMIIGLMPLALAAGAGAEWKNGLAWALIGGLTSSMFLSLIIVPVVYAVFDRFINSNGKTTQITIET